MATLLTEFEFIKPLELYEKEKPYWLFLGKPKDKPDLPPTNVQYDRVSDVPIHDLRGRERDFSLDVHGFKYFEHGQTFDKFDEHDLVNKEFLPQVEQVLLAQIPEAERVFVYDWRYRREAKDYGIVSPAQIEKPGFMLAPSAYVHTDATEFTLKKRVRQHFPDEADRLLEGRVQLVNFWRPMYHTVYNYPLVTCDARSVNMDNLIAVDQIYRHFAGDVYHAPYDPAYKWHFQSKMGPQEGVIFKSWDTAPGDTPPATGGGGTGDLRAKNEHRVSGTRVLQELNASIQ